MQGQKGITLVALIITIIVMLILVAVTVSLVAQTDLIPLVQSAGNEWSASENKYNDITNQNIGGGETMQNLLN